MFNQSNNRPNMKGIYQKGDADRHAARITGDAIMKNIGKYFEELNLAVFGAEQVAKFEREEREEARKATEARISRV